LLANQADRVRAAVRSAKEKFMREIVLSGTAAIVLCFGAGAACAMTGGADLPPEKSPYAILEPQTVMPLAAPEATGNGPDGTIDRVPAPRPPLARPKRNIP
jgi:hypothetical protein